MDRLAESDIDAQQWKASVILNDVDSFSLHGKTLSFSIGGSFSCIDIDQSQTIRIDWVDDKIRIAIGKMRARG
jgi:hypothetical protein